MLGQDIVVALLLAARARQKWSYAALGRAVKQSDSQVHSAVRRLREARLVDPVAWKVRRGSLHEFLVHGLPYVFPSEPRGRGLGVATAWSHEPVRARLGLSEVEILVWPAADGDRRGLVVKPLHAAVPEAVRDDPQLHEWLALVDCLRLGRARERKLAAEALAQDLLADE